MSNKERLDILLVNRGLFESREKAKAAIMAGQIFMDTTRIDKAGTKVPVDANLTVKGNTLPYVSRGGLKLEKAIQIYPIDLTDAVMVDIGASTGGFTDCLLQNGAASVTSVDVGYAQFDWSLRKDSRVELLERTNITSLPEMGYSHVFDVAVCDVSFTSILSILPSVLDVLAPEGVFVTLVKPQFEAKREEVGEGGIVTDASVHLQTLQKVSDAFKEAHMGPLGSCESPIHGAKGNVEYLLFGQLEAGSHDLDLASVVSSHSVEIVK